MKTLWRYAAAGAACWLALSGASAAKRSVAPGFGLPATAVSASITYRKIFKSSYPEFTQVTINASGSATYDIRQLDEDPNPQSFALDANLVRRIFALAGKLHDFDGVKLNVHKRIANLGQKTFEYKSGAEDHEVTFNYTLNPDALQLLGLFDGLARQQGDLSNLQRTMRYDRLGVNDAIAQLESDYNEKVFPDPQALLPVLDQVAADEQLINIARERARTLATRIRAAR